jgi:hypothetical protein
MIESLWKKTNNCTLLKMRAGVLHIMAFIFDRLDKQVKWISFRRPWKTCYTVLIRLINWLKLPVKDFPTAASSTTLFILGSLCYKASNSIVFTVWIHQRLIGCIRHDSRWYLRLLQDYQNSGQWRWPAFAFNQRSTSILGDSIVDFCVDLHTFNINFHTRMSHFTYF